MEKNGEIVLKVKQELLNAPLWHKETVNFVDPLVERLGLHYYVKQCVTCKRNIPRNPPIYPLEALEYHVDTVSLYADLLRSFFHANTTKDDIAEIIYSLRRLGFSEGDFRELGVSHATYYRYLAEDKETENRSISLK